jgi:myo-inositol-1-phosphate synthase
VSGGRIGIWLIGAWGRVGTSVSVALAGLQSRLISTSGLVTEQAEFGHLQLADWSSFVVGGHEIRKTSTTVEARNLFVDSKTVRSKTGTVECLAALAPAITDWDRNIRTGTLLNSGPAIESRASTATLKTRGERPGAALQRIVVDLHEFQRSHDLSHVVVVNVASVDPPIADCDHHSSAQLLELLASSDQSPVSTSALYAVAALQSGHSYLNWTPSTGPSLSALEELALANRALLMGREGRTDLASIGLLHAADDDEGLRSAKALLDAVRLCEREHRRGATGLMIFLSGFFQHAMGNGPRDIASQRALLYDWAREVASAS